MVMQLLAIIKFWTTEVLTGTYCHNNSCIKGKKDFRQSEMNRLLYEASMNSRYRRRLIVTHYRKLNESTNQVYIQVHKFACVYRKLKPDQLYNCVLYRKMMQYGLKFSTKHSSETNNNFENSYLKSIIFNKKKTFYNIPNKIFCNQNNIGLEYFADI